MNELLKFSMANREITEAQIFVFGAHNVHEGAAMVLGDVRRNC